MHEGQRQRDEAYDIARKEFYALRHEEELERRVAKEEALWTGAYFGKSALEVGMELEDKTYDDWLKWAKTNVETLERDRAAAYTSIPEVDDVETESVGEGEEADGTSPVAA
jgi:small subunit ribosomal protein S23